MKVWSLMRSHVSAMSVSGDFKECLSGKEIIDDYQDKRYRQRSAGKDTDK